MDKSGKVSAVYYYGPPYRTNYAVEVLLLDPRFLRSAAISGPSARLAVFGCGETECLHGRTVSGHVGFTASAPDEGHGPPDYQMLVYAFSLSCV